MGASGDTRSGGGRPTLPDDWLKLVKQALTDKGWKARDLAREVGQTDSSISKLLSNKGHVGVPTIRKVQKVLNLPDPLPKPVLARGTRDDESAAILLDGDAIDAGLVEYVELGRRIRAHDPRKFLLFVDALKDLADSFDVTEQKAARAAGVLAGKFSDGNKGSS